MGLVTRQVLTQAGRKVERVAVAEWEGEILLRALSAAQTIAFIEFARAQGDAVDANLRTAAWLLVAAWVDEAGAPILTLDDLDELLANQTAALLHRLGLEVSVLTGMSPQAVASAEKNLESQS